MIIDQKKFCLNYIIKWGGVHSFIISVDNIKLLYYS